MSNLIKLIKLTGAVSGKPVYVNIDDAFLIEQVVEPVNDTNAEFLGKTMIFKNASSHPAMVEETPEEIAAMIQKSQDEQLRMEFIKAALTGMCDVSMNSSPSDLCTGAIYIANTMMEKLKND